MQYFLDTVTGKVHGFQDNVTATLGANGYTFTVAGVPLVVPSTLVPTTPPVIPRPVKKPSQS